MTYEQAVCAKVLIEQTQKKDGKNSISYKELTDEVNKRFNIYIHYRSKLGEVIGDINHWLKNNNYDNVPLISVLVVRKDTGRPGKNFWILYHDIKGINVSQDKERKAKCKKEVESVLKYDWSDISKMVDRIVAARGIVVRKKNT